LAPRSPVSSPAATVGSAVGLPDFSAQGPTSAKGARVLGKAGSQLKDPIALAAGSWVEM